MTGGNKDEDCEDDDRQNAEKEQSGTRKGGDQGQRRRAGDGDEDKTQGWAADKDGRQRQQGDGRQRGDGNDPALPLPLVLQEQHVLCIITYNNLTNKQPCYKYNKFTCIISSSRTW